MIINEIVGSTIYFRNSCFMYLMLECSRNRVWLDYESLLLPHIQADHVVGEHKYRLLVFPPWLLHLCASIVSLGAWWL